MGKVFEKQIKTTQGEKQIDALKPNQIQYLKPKEQTKAIIYKLEDVNDKTSTIKEIYD